MKQKTVEKPGWRQPARPRLRIADCGLRIADWKFLLLMILLVSPTGWAQDNNQSTAQSLAPSAIQPSTVPATQSPDGAPKLITSPGYRLHQGDKIEVRFFYQPELNQETVVKPDGTVSMQLIGDVRAEGITVLELEQRLVQHYSKILLDPIVSVVLKEFVKPRVFVGGQVHKPGPYELRDGDVLAQALLLAGGFTPAAHRKQVIHARPMGEGRMQVTVVDTTKLFTRAPNPDLNLTLNDGDLIYVPESKLSRVSDILNALNIHTFGLSLYPGRR